MDTVIRERFIKLWHKYCPGAELPIAFEVTDDCGADEKAKPHDRWRCVICDLARVRAGRSLLLDHRSVTCAGGRYYMGFESELSADFRYFLSYGKAGVTKGERYKKTPEIVDEITASQRFLSAEGRAYRFRRWDMLNEGDEPEMVIFFARPEVLSALFTLANFDCVDPDGVICPFGSGCSSIIHYPRLEGQKERPRAVLGMFDPSARPCVPLDMLTFSVPMKRFREMVENMEESFLITEDWDAVKKKVARSVTLYS